jgi:hypothetical protein
MVNLHQRYGHYITSGRKHDMVDEKIVGYGWTDDGVDLIGYYVLTENHRLLYNLNEEFISIENL